MLVVTRKNEQAVRIGNDIWIKVKCKGQAKLIIQAPQHVPIVRDELLTPEVDPSYNSGNDAE